MNTFTSSGSTLNPLASCPPLVEWLFNTPSHHRVHHDRRVHKNYAAIFIVWDRCAPPPAPIKSTPYSLTSLAECLERSP